MNDKYLIITDVDGCLTDNTSSWDCNGNESIKFNKSDGLAISEFKRCGHKVVALSGRYVEATSHRTRTWGIDYITTDNKVRYLKRFKIVDGIVTVEGPTNGMKVIIIGNDYNDIEMIKLGYTSYLPSDAIIGNLLYYKHNNVVNLDGVNGGCGVLAKVAQILNIGIYDNKNGRNTNKCII